MTDLSAHGDIKSYVKPPMPKREAKAMIEFWASLGHPSQAGPAPTPSRRARGKYPRQRSLGLLPEMRAAEKRALRLRLIAHFGGKCLECGIVGPPAIYQFDHRDPFAKVRNVSRYITWEEALAEAQKCDLLCCNCHAIRTQSDPRIRLKCGGKRK